MLCLVNVSDTEVEILAFFKKRLLKISIVI